MVNSAKRTYFTITRPGGEITADSLYQLLVDGEKKTVVEALTRNRGAVSVPEDIRLFVKFVREAIRSCLKFDS